VDVAAPRLYKAAHYARRLLGDPRSVVLAADTGALFPHADLGAGAQTFVRRARQALAVGDGPGAPGGATAAAAADLYRGDLLPDDPYETGLGAPRDRLRQLHRDWLARARPWAR